MSKFHCSYAYNVPCYCDFTVEANSEQEAEAIIQQALKDGRFETVECDPFWESTDNHRVFVAGNGQHSQYEPMTELPGYITRPAADILQS